MQLTKPKCIIFDWDNTMISTWPIMAASLNTAFEKFNKPKLSVEEVKAHAHKSLRDAFPEIFGSAWEEARDIYYTTYTSHKNLEILPGALETLQLLRKHSIPCCILSNKRGDLLRNEIARLNWDEYIAVAIGSLDAPHDKPHPDSVKKVLESISLKPSSEIWFVGDATVDIECAVNSGLHPVLYGDKTAAPDIEEKGWPYMHAVSHSNLQQILSQLLTV